MPVEATLDRICDPVLSSMAMTTVKSDRATGPVANAVNATLITAEGFTLVISDETAGGEVLAVTYVVNGVTVTEDVFKTAAQVKTLELLRLLVP